MVTLSYILCVVIYWFYNRTGIDWLFADTARDWEEGTRDSSSWPRKLMAKIYRSRNGFPGVVTFVIASINIDPVIVAVHYQKSRHFHGIGYRDWSILAGAVAIGNLWWGARIGLFVKILEWLIKHF